MSLPMIRHRPPAPTGPGGRHRPFGAGVRRVSHRLHDLVASSAGAAGHGHAHEAHGYGLSHGLAYRLSGHGPLLEPAYAENARMAREYYHL